MTILKPTQSRVLSWVFEWGTKAYAIKVCWFHYGHTNSYTVDWCKGAGQSGYCIVRVNLRPEGGGGGVFHGFYMESPLDRAPMT